MGVSMTTKYLDRGAMNRLHEIARRFPAGPPERPQREPDTSYPCATREEVRDALEAEGFGRVSCERIRQIENQALSKLRSLLAAQGLRIEDLL